MLDGNNPYASVRCSPINFSDPSGCYPGQLTPGECLYDQNFNPVYCEPKPPLFADIPMPNRLPSTPAPPPAPHKHEPKPQVEPPKGKPISLEELEALAEQFAPHYHYEPFAELVFGTALTGLGLAEAAGAVLTSETVVGGVALGAQAGDDIGTGVAQIVTGK